MQLKGGKEKFWPSRLTASPSPVHQCIYQAQVKVHLYQVQVKVVMASMLLFGSLISSLKFAFFHSFIVRLRDKSPRSEDLEADDEQGDKTDNDHDR